MAVVTANEMATYVLRVIGALEGLATAPAEDQAVALASTRAVYEKLREFELAYWQDDGAPLFLKEDLARYIGCHCASLLIPTRAEQYMAMHRDDALREIRRLLESRTRTTSTTEAIYY